MFILLSAGWAQDPEQAEGERMYWRMERYAKRWPPDWLPRMQVAAPLPACPEPL